MANDRRDAIDVARVMALLIVVLGHLTLAVVDRHDGAVRGANILELHPGWAWVAAAAPMPIFFAAAGWANAHATLASAVPRIRTLVGVAAVVIASWTVGVLVAQVVAGDAGVVADGARIATQPAWFLAAYVPFAAAGGPLARWSAGRSPVITIGSLLVVLLLLDFARFGLNAPQWITWPGFYVAWAVPWIAGGWWRGLSLRGVAERKAGVVLFVGAVVAAVVLVRWFGYSPALIDAVPGKRSNTTPPTLYTAIAALAQVGALMVGARALDRAGKRWRKLWDRAGEAAVGIYLWHLSALALCGGAIALGMPVPERLTTAWWLTRPLWWAAVIGVALGFVLATDAVRGRLRKKSRSALTQPQPVVVVLFGVVLTAAGAGLVGLRGPRSAPLALWCTGLFVAAWLAFREQRVRATS